MNLLKLTVLGMVCLVVSCQDPVTFDSRNSGYLVVDGFITDQAGPHTIRLATAGEFKGIFDGGDELPLREANVTIQDDLEEVILLTETSPGFYSTPIAFQAMEGRSYTLQIETSEGVSYQSEQEQFVPSGPVDSVYYDTAVVPVLNTIGNVSSKLVVNFYADFTFPEKNYFYRWTWDGTYILDTEYLESEGDDPMALCDLNNSALSEVVPEFCYVQETPDGGYVRLLSSNTSQNLTNEGVLILSKDVDFNWKNAYNMHISQFSMTERSFEFWEEVERQKGATGSIFDPTPARIDGNIKNVDDSSEPVLGFFGVYGVHDWRVQVPGIDTPSAQSACLTPLLVDDERHPIYCCDCSFYPRSTPVKPSFWID